MSSTRPSRSASIPIPRSSASPIYNIDSVLSIPFVAPAPVSPRSRQQQPFPQRASVDDGSGHLAARGSPALAASLGGSVPRSVTHPGNSFHGRVVSGTPSSAHAAAAAIRTFEPRVVRGTSSSVDASRTTDNACLPSTSAPSSSRMRRPSAAGSSRAPSAQRSSQVFSTSPPPSHPMPFPRPAYLEHSALRHLLQTEAPPALPASRKTDPSSSSSATGVYDYSHPLVHTAAMSPPTDSDEESNVSPPRELPSTSRTITYPPQQMLKLPTRWDEQFRNSLLSVSSDGRDLTFHGASCAGDRDAAAARTSCPIPPACGIYYYEVEIVSKGQKGHISIGFAARDVKLSRLPGWEANSWGYHGDDGYSFAAEKNGTPYGPTFGTGDIIGCGVDFSTYKAFFTKNGSLIGHVFDNIGKDVDLYPSVGMRHTGEAVRVNFGQDPFKYDIDYHVQQQRNTVWSKILTTTLDTSLLDGPRLSPDSSSKDSAAISYESKPKVPLSTEQTKTLLNELVVSYLAHHGYAKTVRAFKAQQSSFEKSQPAESKAESSRDVDMESVSVERTDSYDIERRTQIVNSVVTGDVDYAIAQTKLHYPAVLEADEGLIHFKLRCRKFVELILEAAELKKKLRSRIIESESVADEMDGIYEDGMNMDVDDDASVPQPAVTNGFDDPAPVASKAQTENSTALYEAALNEAIAYGQALSNDFKSDTRPEVRQHFKRTFSIVAWDDPAAAGGVASEVVGYDAKVGLATELNEAILKHQGLPARPALETLYRHTAACVTQLGLLGVGSAAFADMSKEFLDA